MRETVSGSIPKENPVEIPKKSFFRNSQTDCLLKELQKEYEKSIQQKFQKQILIHSIAEGSSVELSGEISGGISWGRIGKLTKRTIGFILGERLGRTSGGIIQETLEQKTTENPGEIPGYISWALLEKFRNLLRNFRLNFQRYC